MEYFHLHISPFHDIYRLCLKWYSMKAIIATDDMRWKYRNYMPFVISTLISINWQELTFSGDNASGMATLKHEFVQMSWWNCTSSFNRRQVMIEMKGAFSWVISCFKPFRQFDGILSKGDQMRVMNDLVSRHESDNEIIDNTMTLYRFRNELAMASRDNAS